MQESSQSTAHAHSVRSYVRRQHRITPGQVRALHTWWEIYDLSRQPEWLNGDREYVLEIGFGMGQSLLAEAAANPAKNFIGIEVHTPGIGALLLATAQQKIDNLRVFHGDALVILNQYIKDNSLSKIQIFFPDPWPKLRHQKRRLIQTDFVNLLVSKLKSQGYLHLATDWQDYAEQMLRVAAQVPGLVNCAGEHNYLPHRNGRLMTKFEQRGIQLGHTVKDLLLIKTI
jgi:tRNA (guanine-N7-)-methyltransferase